MKRVWVRSEGGSGAKSRTAWEIDQQKSARFQMAGENPRVAGVKQENGAGWV